MDNKLTTKDFWVFEESEYNFQRYTDGHGIDTFIKKYIPSNPTGKCLEIGSFPGPHLATFGDLGYTLSGVDFHPLNEKALPAWLLAQNFKIDEFVTTDFFEFEPKKKFDVVCSFGFIEHFVDYKDVILKHAHLVNDNGYLLITTPNFRGKLQLWLHRQFDKTNLSMHNIDSMQPKEWKKLLDQNGFDVLYEGFFGGFWFWHSTEEMPSWKKRVLWFVDRIIPRLRKLLWFESASFSAYAGIVAVKRKTI